VVRFLVVACFALLAFAPASARAQTLDAPLGEAPAPVEVARAFYDAFSSHDGMDTLEKLYAPDVKWKDPIFHFDDRAGTMGMWRILNTAAKNRTVTYRIVSAEGDTVTVEWLADYELLGRKVHNDVTATLVIVNGKIVRHTDDYSWKKWSEQALPLGDAASSWPLQAIVLGSMRFAMDVAIAWNALKARLEAAKVPSASIGLSGALEKATGAK
jgi:ketosteroid isomerase-like protein